jgi:hypothetical protein
MLWAIAKGVLFRIDVIPYGYYRLIDADGNFVTDNDGNVIIDSMGSRQ